MDTDAQSGPLDEPSTAAADTMFAKRGCCCFWIPWSGDRPKKWERIHMSDRTDERASEQRWWSRGWRAVMKVREWSEIVAGPRWKTFIRRFNRNPRFGTRPGGKFQYDPLSYALNFDEGHGQNGDFVEDNGFPDFSARFAAPPVSAKSSIDLGGRDAPPLFAVAGVVVH